MRRDPSETIYPSSNIIINVDIPCMENTLAMGRGQVKKTMEVERERWRKNGKKGEEDGKKRREKGVEGVQ